MIFSNLGAKLNPAVSEISKAAKPEQLNLTMTSVVLLSLKIILESKIFKETYMSGTTYTPPKLSGNLVRKPFMYF